jgi:hypothetical protein
MMVQIKEVLSHVSYPYPSNSAGKPWMSKMAHKEQGRPTHEEVPVELWSEIICHLEPRDILSLSHVRC